MKRSLMLLLIGLLWWQPLAMAWGQTNAVEAELIRLDSISFLGQPVQLAQQADAPFQPLDRSDLWTNATYALAGSSLSNLLLIAAIAALSIGQEALAPGSTAYLDQAGPFALALDLVPAVATPVLMHIWSPEADTELFGASLIGSLVASALQLALMAPIFFTFNQGNVSDTYYVVLPVAVSTAILFQALGSAWGHELGQNLSFSNGSSTSHTGSTQGVILTYHWSY